MKILVTGADGQLGSAVISELERRKIPYIGVDISDMDITCRKSVFDCLRLHEPSCVIHCAAYTAVDNAENEPDLCMRVNADGTEYIAAACLDTNSKMIYISTDYVFGGDGDTPHEIDSPKSPLSVYGKSKLAGEGAVQQILEKYCIVRTSWVFGKNGNNFVKTMLRLAQTGDEINVVSDQVGSPTYVSDLAILLCDMALAEKYGIYHATNEGFCSWAVFAEEIMRLAGSECKIIPIPSEQYPSKATRPKNSRLSKASLDEAGFSRLPNWKDALERMLAT